ncbi:MAG TPA: bifunctional diaminohydroxyphosphoribosylaminopyrimidine deaminase/5-amino-6-(5-phosphoribosylamino)uracil reductase RibD [Dehalococcoidia bacterium]|nr:bifunctional diaminohydroxyphosphoribosylaminopyrimidine deaminase/5-amino-6-(5-phosphoribosylamino)uracil reductase RibD [Dehalococcoidia bacterium]
MSIPEPMQRALDLARSAPEVTSPNPTVGAVIVADGRVIGEGVTQPPPGPHAEVVALRAAGASAKGATMYVTLEPHPFHGRTPPCTEAIIAAGIAEVHYAVADPDQRSAGGGHRALEAAGIRVVAGEGEAEARRINEAFFKHRTAGLPFVIAKFAASLDGRIAAASGDSRWVSGPETRAWAHELRTRIDAILVGSSTIVVDDPLLTARPGGVDAPRQPLRVVVDTRGRTPPMAQVFTGPAKTLVATGQHAPPDWRAAIEARGAEVISFPESHDHVDLRPLLEELARRDVLTLLVEGGGVILGSFFDAGLVDKVHAVIAPMIIGAADAPSAVAGVGADRMADALRLREVTVDRLGEDILVTGYAGGE